MKRTASIKLVLLGALSLVACSEQQEMRRDVYRSRGDCVQDWGDETKCEPNRAHHGLFFGPSYVPRIPGSIPGGQAAPGVAPAGKHAAFSQPVVSGSVSRGGFGSMGRFFSSGG